MMNVSLRSELDCHFELTLLSARWREKMHSDKMKNEKIKLRRSDKLEQRDTGRHSIEKNTSLAQMRRHDHRLP
jgi:hypothetical protein